METSNDPEVSLDAYWNVRVLIAQTRGNYDRLSSALRELQQLQVTVQAGICNPQKSQECIAQLKKIADSVSDEIYALQQLMTEYTFVMIQDLQIANDSSQSEVDEVRIAAIVALPDLMDDWNEREQIRCDMKTVYEAAKQLRQEQEWSSYSLK